MKRRFTEKSFLGVAFCLLAGVLFGACSPKVYVIDRQTVLEEEAAGEWPDFESQTMKHSETATPVPLAKTPVTESKKRLYRVLNGDVVTGSR